MFVGAFDQFANDIALACDCSDDSHFVRTAGRMSFFVPMAVFVLAPDVGLVYFNFAHELWEIGILHGRPDTMAHIPGRAVVPTSDLSVNLQGANTLLALCHQIDDLEPSTQGVIGVLENGLGDNRETVAIPTAAFLVFADPMEWAVFKLIYLFIVAARAAYSIRPAHRLEETFTRFLSREPLHHFGQGHRGLCCIHETEYSN
jgi:hypothetical protein